MSQFEHVDPEEVAPQFEEAYPEPHPVSRSPAVEQREFLVTTQVQKWHPWVTGILALICVIMFVFMTVRGVSAVRPTGADGYRFGANFGPAVIVDHEWWRVLTCQFVHFGIIHIVFNMWCLLSLGPLVERLYGSPFFLALYLLSGVGGALLSLAVNPTIIGAGASGAIFGVIGGLAAFLLIHRHTIPAATLKSLRGSVTGFVGYNLLIGAVTPNVDNAAHVGGLITGFLVGLAVQRPWPVTQPHRAVLRRLAGLGVSVALLYVAGTFAVRWAAANPKVAEVKGRVDDNRSAVGAYNRFIRGIEPQVLSSDLISRQVEQVLKDVDTETVTAEQALDKLREILDYTTRQRDLTQSMSMERADLSSIRLALVRVQDSLIDAIRLSMTLIQTTEGPQAEAIAKQFDEACEKKVQAERDFEESVRAYATLHNMTLRPK